MAGIKRKIVIINDDPLVSKIYGEYFQKAQFEVKFFNKAPENLIETILNEKPDVISIDLTLPEISGIEVTKKLKTHPKTKDIPIIGLCNISDKKTIREAIEAGMDDYFIDYQISPQDYVRAIRGFLQTPDKYQKNYKRLLGEEEKPETEEIKEKIQETVKAEPLKTIAKEERKEIRKKRIFLSGPFQTKEQQKILEKIQKELREKGHEIFIGPRDIDNYGQIKVSPSIFWRAIIHEIEISDVLLIDIKEIDFKRALEIGIGKAKNKKIILLLPSGTQVEDWIKGAVDKIFVYDTKEHLQEIIKKELKLFLESEI
jgi:CheY-like chemotaxis protein